MMEVFFKPSGEDVFHEEAARSLPQALPEHRRQRIVVLSSYTPSLTNFRLELLKRMVKAGHRVTAVGPEDDAETKAVLLRVGVQFVQVPMARVGLNPIADLATLWAIWRLLRKLNPDMIVPYTMKPIIYGGIAAQLAGVRSRCFLVTGLGHVFSDTAGVSLKGQAVRRLSVWLYRRAFAGAKAVFVYNQADAADIRENGMLRDPSLMRLVPGSGVDLAHYTFSPARIDRPVFLLIARLLKDKGIAEYVEAARRVLRLHPTAEFQLLGHFDPNLSAGFSPDEIQQWVDEGILNYLGTTQDVRPCLAQCNIFVLPSYYREGIPRSILEAMSVGRAIITTNLAGCSDTVQGGTNGLLVEPRNVDELANAMESLAADLSRVKAMGCKSRELAETKFDVHIVNDILIDRMGLDSKLV